MHTAILNSEFLIPNFATHSYSAVPRNVTRFRRKFVRRSGGKACHRRIMSRRLRSLSRATAASLWFRPGRFFFKFKRLLQYF